MMSEPGMLIRYACQAMGTQFEAFLFGQDRSHLDAVANVLWEKARSIEKLLSRLDPASEVYRINLLTSRRPVRINFELMSILQTCREYSELTKGSFDVARDAQNRGADRSLQLDATKRTIRFCIDGTTLDFGGFGKGYALDRISELLTEAGITSALIHAGTSSILAMGDGPHGNGWPVAIDDPYSKGQRAGQVTLSNCALSCSGVFRAGQEISDIVDRRTGQPLQAQSNCIALAPSAAEAEALSTACLAMGYERASVWATEHDMGRCKIGFIDSPKRSPRLRWISKNLAQLPVSLEAT